MSDFAEVLLTIRVENLPNKEAFGVSDPYYTISLGDHVLYQSEVIVDDIYAPQWSTAHFKIPEAAFWQPLRIRVGDSEYFSELDSDLLIEWEVMFPFRRSAYISEETSTLLYILKAIVTTSIDMQVLNISRNANFGHGQRYLELYCNKDKLYTSEPIENESTVVRWRGKCPIPTKVVKKKLKVKVRDHLSVEEKKKRKLKSDPILAAAEIWWPFQPRTYKMKSKFDVTLAILNSVGSINVENGLPEDEFRVVEVVPTTPKGEFHVPNGC